MIVNLIYFNIIISTFQSTLNPLQIQFQFNPSTPLTSLSIWLRGCADALKVAMQMLGHEAMAD